MRTDILFVLFVTLALFAFPTTAEERYQSYQQKRAESTTPMLDSFIESVNDAIVWTTPKIDAALEWTVPRVEYLIEEVIAPKVEYLADKVVFPVVVVAAQGTLYAAVKSVDFVESSYNYLCPRRSIYDTLFKEPTPLQKLICF